VGNKTICNEKHGAYEEQPHRPRGTKPFITRNNLEVYEEQPYRLKGTKHFITRNNVEVYEEQPNRLREQVQAAS
jgi:hypothetical protein